MVDAAYNSNKAVVQEHVQRFWVLLGADPNIYCSITVCGFGVPRRRIWLSCNPGKGSMRWIYIWFHDIHGNWRLPIVH